MKICTVDWNPKGKIDCVRGQNPITPFPIFSQFFTPIMHCQWQGLKTTVLSPVHRGQRLIAQKTLLNARYTGDIVAIVNNVMII